MLVDHPQRLLRMARSAYQALTPPGAREPSHVADLLALLSATFAVLALIFIVDWSSLGAGGLRIGGSAAVTVYLVLRGVWARWQQR